MSLLSNIKPIPPEEIIKTMKHFHSLIGAVIGAMKTIEESDDKDVIDSHICIIELCCEQLDYAENLPHANIRKQIRDGVGDYSKIKDKCISMGLV